MEQKFPALVIPFPQPVGEAQHARALTDDECKCLHHYRNYTAWQDQVIMDATGVSLPRFKGALNYYERQQVGDVSPQNERQQGQDKQSPQLQLRIQRQHLQNEFPGLEIPFPKGSLTQTESECIVRLYGRDMAHTQIADVTGAPFQSVLTATKGFQRPVRNHDPGHQPDQQLQGDQAHGLLPVSPVLGEERAFIAKKFGKITFPFTGLLDDMKMEAIKELHSRNRLSYVQMETITGIPQETIKRLTGFTWITERGRLDDRSLRDHQLRSQSSSALGASAL